ncbi:type 1 glutamine amidotransferase [Myxococcus sp. RHSTA-1-4]|uniref:type 1 glutamine amidotransferase n=1 Tax=Myxococcus sp. RHSTA-1-4 TaxID=2874601 RepID=UPI001CBC6C92|nr:type 1 glutamine amidotransferase [Myxococcus sp. RHSTA-1-4]
MVIQDELSLGLGLLEPALLKARFSVERRIHGVEAEDAHADLLVVLGGSLTTPEAEQSVFLTRVRNLLERRLADARPVLGICLGAQLLSLAGGGRIPRNRAGPLLGIAPVVPTAEGRMDSLFRGPLQRLDVVHWHEDVFELPPRSVRLASSRACANEAFRLGNAWGLLFHLQADFEQFNRWLQLAAATGKTGGRTVEEIRSYDLWRLRAVQRRNEQALDRLLGEVVRTLKANELPDGPTPA